jgi:hypothetical protein
MAVASHFPAGKIHSRVRGCLKILFNCNFYFSAAPNSSIVGKLSFKYASSFFIRFARKLKISF